MSSKQYLAIEQHGHMIRLKTQHPRKELMELFGRTNADKMYIDNHDGTARHVGYVIGGHWITLYQLRPWQEESASMTAPRVESDGNTGVPDTFVADYRLAGVRIEPNMPDSDMVERKHLVTAWESRDAMAAECARIRAELQQLKDMRSDHVIEFDMVREALGVSIEPHQTLLERVLDAAHKKDVTQVCDGEVARDNLDKFINDHIKDRVVAELSDNDGIVELAESDYKKLMEFIKQIARMETASEFDERTDDEGMSGDDAVETLSGLIEASRKLIGEAV